MLVIGSGPAGQKAAIQAAKLRKRVAIIEKDASVGGYAVNTSTLPSKTLKDAIYCVHGLKLRALSRITTGLRTTLSLGDLMARKDQVIKNEVAIVKDQLRRNHVDIINGTASFVDAHQLRVTTPDGPAQKLSASFIVIATGSRPRRLEQFPFDDKTICDSDSILTTKIVPQSIAVIGGGIIGCEYASMFAAFGIKVTLLDRRRELIRYIDLEIVQALTEQLHANGVTLRLGEEIEGVQARRDGRVVTRIAGGESVITDMLLCSMGRYANTRELNLDEIGLKTDHLGQLTVNQHYQTAIPHIYAAGDIIGYPALASTSMEQGRLAAAHAFQGAAATMPAPMPLGIYTIPEISTVGKNEEQLRAEGVPYGVGRAFYKEIARGQISGDLDGLLKLLFHRDTRQLLGVHIIGEGATELLHIGQTVLAYGGTVDFLVHNVFNYPTLAECYRTAALDGLNRVETND